MIRYALTCNDGHQFESWFQSASAFEKLLDAGMVSCAVCGGVDVKKSLMAPRIGAATQDTPAKRPLSTPATPAEQAVADLKRKVEENSDYVGKDFAKEARAIHSGEAPERAIYGEAKPAEAKKLIDEGVPVLPLPFTPARNSN
ncbi:DUF1178 family protein [Actibacterium lipolyticum]|uniref:DUF1178 domain-containing protein n=1 Tax=Actibacterium lipolyticum TaxID=1524263 RepID=A0A238KMB9_9RHOB|nr:DUF1178 family protein [Actibacterium lipolyticum]SMX43858.1 hypothetical protein COL8621_02396 [Actibacterium lipolyticum]